MVRLMKRFVLASCAVVMALPTLALAHPGHEGHGLAPESPLLRIAAIALVAHGMVGVAWFLLKPARNRRSKRR